MTTLSFRRWLGASARAHARTVAALQLAAVERKTDRIGMAIAMHEEARNLFEVWRAEYHEREAESVMLYLGFARAAQLASGCKPMPW